MTTSTDSEKGASVAERGMGFGLRQLNRLAGEDDRGVEVGLLRRALIGRRFGLERRIEAGFTAAPALEEAVT